MLRLTVHDRYGTRQIDAIRGTPLYVLLARFPDAPLRPCGGSGKCGRCAVYAKGRLDPAPDKQGRVLACQARLMGDAEVWLPKREILTQIETHTQEHPSVIQPMEGNYAAAVDVGTTTVVLRLLRLRDGAALATVACENPQRVIGADVIGRIAGAMVGQLPMLSSMIRETVDEMEKEAIRRANVPIDRADVRAVTGNTTMLYLYEGRDPEPLSHAPFEADCRYGQTLGRDYLPRCMGAFVGADITCAVLSSGICRRKEIALLIDLGTNGEIALWNGRKLTCCATAAGPAFEGGGISQGVSSIPGAVDRVWLEDGVLRFHTIQNCPPAGVCGSGLVDWTATLLDCGVLDESGALEATPDAIGPLVLTQQDLRQVQLAKGAIAAGMETLLKDQGLCFGDVDTLYIAGGFGSHLNMKSAARIGLIPSCLADRAVCIGNAALGGAERILLDRNAAAEAEQIAEEAECQNLGGNPAFSDAFMERMAFEVLEGSRTEA